MKDDVSIIEIWQVLWRKKLFIIGFTLVFAILSVVIALSLPNIYRAEITVGQSEESKNGGLSGLAGQLGGLGAIAGLNLNAQQSDKGAIALEILTSRAFLSDFIEKYDILPQVMAAEEWNPVSGKLSYNTDIYNPESNEWVRDVEPPKTPKPSLWEAVNTFREDILVIEEDTETGFATISVFHPSAPVAAEWVSNLLFELNEKMRVRDVTEAEKSIAYLEEKLQTTQLANMQEVFAELIERQLQTMMLANARDEYIFETLDPAVIPEDKAKPNRPLICIVITLLGGILSVLFVLTRHYLRQS
ncbi:putative tyrosine kinase-like protein [Idiomarina aquatica]|uniref:Putative tyrosine kinase-like protein n=1 Tax=Idiomarina aquatica TaxID=1327752 RepID=A0A4R6PQZ6_9GAMM|nr:Wzz/FepE/Etk N-terminal domain-containing protein [Idiomarina aquatica]TDP40251.1 putative tyrosine kinase-like protein [Idiomarina aquatica]